MDPICTTTCPWGHGDDPNALATFSAYPGPNSPGGDGLNTGGFTWSAPNPERLNTYIAKLDYQLSDRQRLFVRGNLQGDRTFFATGVPRQSSQCVRRGHREGHCHRAHLDHQQYPH